MNNNYSMNRRSERHIRGIVKNKLCGLALLGLGVLTLVITKDATALLMGLLIGIPLLITKEEIF